MDEPRVDDAAIIERLRALNDRLEVQVALDMQAIHALIAKVQYLEMILGVDVSCL